jgi:hypothetical protein
MDSSCSFKQFHLWTLPYISSVIGMWTSLQENPRIFSFLPLHPSHNDQFFKFRPRKNQNLRDYSCGSKAAISSNIDIFASSMCCWTRLHKYSRICTFLPLHPSHNDRFCKSRPKNNRSLRAYYYLKKRVTAIQLIYSSLVIARETSL